MFPLIFLYFGIAPKELFAFGNYIISRAPHNLPYHLLSTFMVLIGILCGILAALAYFFSLATTQDAEKRSEYECGFAPFDSATRHPFEVHFYVVGILFLIFDVEIALLFP